jgi:protein involved in polysaccharide export with SLBB domain
MVVFDRRSPRTARYVRPSVGWLTVLATLTVSGCAPKHDQMVAFLRSQEVEVSTGHYVVRPPDVIAIHSPDAPELDGTSQAVRSDGKIVLRLVGEVDVAGLTTEEIAAKLKAQLSRYYIDPEVLVEVAGYNSQFYYVFGEVSGPGAKRYTGRDTLLKALADAQPTFLAWRSQIKILRPSVTDEDRKTIIVNLDRMLNGGDLTNDILLQEGDVIQVPPTPLAWVGLRVRELMYPVEPVVNAYNMPTGPMQTTQTYQDGYGTESYDSNYHRRRLFP